MNSVLSLLRLALGAVVFLAGSFVFVLVALPLLPWRVARIKACNLYGKIVGRSIVFLAGATPNVTNASRLDSKRPAIYVANHASTLDLFLCIWLCPFGGCGVMKKQMLRLPIFGQLAWLSGHLMLDRENKDRAIEALRSTGEFVKQHGLSIWIMPEGTRSKDGRLQPLKKGFVHLAIATGLPVVPVVIHGAHRNWKMNEFGFTPMTLDVDVKEPIDTSSWREETASEHAASVHARFALWLREDQRPLPAAPVSAAAKVA
ncbi:MAG: 1-acyl-sn-glycerol-3-phosphate acyltransferase [Deltaproteobacteria bacterium]|nr:1-acyl-sn-glycerol-3-phosphate acyltransferase [Deltaproteobacteria bacterium]